MNFDFEDLVKAMQNADEDRVAEFNALDEMNHNIQFQLFKEHYEREECYLCKKSFKTHSSENPCVHSILRKGKFKKKDFPKIYARFGYTNIAAFCRWCANMEHSLSNINNLSEGVSERKLFSYTVKWKNIEWSFDCSKNDYAGHIGNAIDYPHYHFQMRIEGKQFINFNDFHVRFSEQDLVILKLSQHPTLGFGFDFGAAGAGMEEAMQLNPEDIVQFTSPSKDEEESTYHLSTFIYSPDVPITGEELRKIFEQSEKEDRTLASVAQERLSHKAAVSTQISASEHVPQIAGRTEHKRR